MAKHTLTEAARLLSDDEMTIGRGGVRKWCLFFADHLSDSANPQPIKGKPLPRKLTEADIEVLRFIRDQRKSNYSLQSIHDHLHNVSFGDVEEPTTEPSTTVTTPSQTPQLSVEQSEALHILSKGFDSLTTDIKSIQSRMNEMEKDKFNLSSFMMGMGVAVIFMVLIGLVMVSIQ